MIKGDLKAKERPVPLQIIHFHILKQHDVCFNAITFFHNTLRI
jgi:hypothetical protein